MTGTTNFSAEDLVSEDKNINQLRQDKTHKHLLKTLPNDKSFCQYSV